MCNRNHRGYWTKENCLKAAKLCNTRSDFKNLYSQASRKCRENGWLDEAYSHMVIKTVVHRGYWQDYDNCFNAAKQCITASEFERKYPYYIHRNTHRGNYKRRKLRYPKRC